MLFSSITFLFAFLPVVLSVYYICPRKIKNFVLMLCSMFFYAWGEPKYILVMIVSILVGYFMGRLTELFIEKERKKTAKLIVVLSVFINLGILFFFKYIGFFCDNFKLITGVDMKIPEFALPLGISFYTFQILSYSIDVYRQKVKAQKNLINLAAYITLFPQLIAGPIVRYETVAKELEERNESMDDFAYGIRRFVNGLGKKVLIANVAGEIFDTLSNLPSDENSVLLAWICSIAFSLQIYFDFSGYSDMAIGLGRMFGFHFLENFNYPYISKSITEFWRRWHISLSSWFRDYVYIPLGGSKSNRLKTFRNIFIVWFLTGFWHGASWNFIIWGIYYFVLLILEKMFINKWLERIPTFFSHAYTLFFVNFGWVIFAYDKMGVLLNCFRNMFGFGGMSLINENTMFYILSYGIFFVIAFIAATPLPKKIAEIICDSKSQKLSMGIMEALFLLFVLILSTAFLASEAFNPFLYFRF